MSAAKDYRDAVIEAFADDNAALIERVAFLEAERDSWALVARAGIHHAHDAYNQSQRLSEQLAGLRDENRQLREVLMTEQTAA